MDTGHGRCRAGVGRWYGPVPWGGVRGPRDPGWRGCMTFGTQSTKAQGARSHGLCLSGDVGTRDLGQLGSPGLGSRDTGEHGTVDRGGLKGIGVGARVKRVTFWLRESDVRRSIDMIVMIGPKCRSACFRNVARALRLG